MDKVMNKIRLLLIEDSEADAALLVRELEKAGCTIESRRVDNSGELGKAVAEGEWDIILCDYVIPGFGGLEALAQLRSTNLDVPVIMISGHIGEDVAVGAMQSGASDYIMKGSLKRLAPAVQRELREAADRHSRKKIERELEKKTRELEMARKMDKLKDEFINLISHELRNPLTAMVGNLYLLKTERDLSQEEIIEMADGAYHEAWALGAMLDNLLQIARARAKRLHLSCETLDLDRVINDVIVSVRKDNRHRIVTDIAPDTPAVRADLIRLRRVLINLIDNAIKFSPDGGDVTISAARQGQEVVVGVHDAGVGMSPEQLKGLFKPFSRLEKGHAHTGGIGLGLIVCRQLCEAQGGRIWVESKKGGGSSFYFTIPVAA